MHAFTRTLVAALAILALAAPVASARIDPPPAGPGPSAQTQDLRHLAAGAASRGPVNAAPAPSRSSDYWSYAYQATKPAPHPDAPAAPATTTADDDIPWLTIGFGVAGAFLLVSAAAAAVAVTRRPGRAGIA
jgi:hypothetical protein